MKTEKSVYQKAILVVIVSAVLSMALYVSDNLKKLPENKAGNSMVERNAHGKGEKNQELIAGTEDQKAKVTVKIQEEMYTGEELQNVFEASGKQLETLVLGENQSLDEVRNDLNLVKTIPDTGIEVTWELSDYNVMNILGEIQPKKLKEEGTVIELKALLAYGEEKAEHSFFARVFPPKLDDVGQFQKMVEGKAQEADEEQKESRYLVLPKEIGGKEITWKYAKDFRGLGLLALGVVAAALLFALEKQNEIQKQKARRHQLAMDYPEFISTFTLYLGAGMPVRRAWLQIASSYQKQDSPRYVYEEMVYTMREMQRGTPENECYEHFGARCGLPVYRKFAVMLSQNLRKGTKGLSELLQREAAGAFEERKTTARKVGEETSTKLLGPMFLMLGVVLMIIVVPAFLTIQI